MTKIISCENIKEGEVFCKWLRSRLLTHNKNVLGAELGPTGSGKSYRDLRKAELWYTYYLKRPFPARENICFGVSKVIQRLSSGELKKGDILIFEEAGANLGSLDFQSKVSKMFTYVLQSFRSMNVAIFFNLPYLSMLNKQARMLLHYSFESCSIDYEKKMNKCKPFFHQVNQSTGKIYKKYPRIKYQGGIKTIKRFNFNLPSQELINIYEAKKQQYLSDLTQEYTLQLNKLEEDKLVKLGRPIMSEKQLEVYNLACEGLNQPQIAKILNKSQQSVCSILKTLLKHGYKIKKVEIPKENTKNRLVLPLLSPVT